MGSPSPVASSGPGRAQEFAAVIAFFDALETGGRGLVIEGEIGVGKTALLDAVIAEVQGRGHRVLRCAGQHSSSPIGYAALHELLHPVLRFTDALPERQQDAVRSAFGLGDGDAGDPLLVALGALGLLEEAARPGPMLIAVEDADRLDPSSAEALAFIAARLSAPVLILATRRPRSPGDHQVDQLPFERLHLGALPNPEAKALLEQIAPDLPAGVRARILLEAAGNPLALREFTAAVQRFGLDQLSLQPWLPLTERLERAYQHQLSALTPGSRRLLLVVAAAGPATLVEVMAAAELLGLDMDDLDQLERSDLVTVTGPELKIRHPSLRSVLMQTSSTLERLRVHQALAQVTTDPARAIGHRSNATLQRDEQIAAALENVATQARSRGALAEAKTLYHRAAVHSVDPDDRARRLTQAAESARGAGLISEAEPLLDQAESFATKATLLADIAVSRTSIGLTAGTARNAGNDLLTLSRRLAEGTTGCGDQETTELRVRLLWLAALNARGRGLPREDWQRIEAELRSVTSTSPLKPVALALLAPLGEHAELRAELPGLVPELLHFPLGMLSLAVAAESLQDLETALTCWGLSHELFRERGMSVDESQALKGRANVHLLRGRIKEATEDAEHALRLAQDAGMPLISAMAAASLARAHALVGNVEAAREAISRCDASMGSRPVALASADVRWAKGLLALHTGRHQDALVEFMHVSVHPTRALWIVADVTEAAVRSQRADLVRANVDRAETVAQAYTSPHLRMLVQRSRALLSEGEQAHDHFTQALEAGRISQSPLELARTKLLFGEWLRRERRVAQARRELSEAQALFSELDAKPFIARAAAELRASGQADTETGGRPLTGLTPQEMQVARLAAEGMSNKEIADRAYLSHRTVSAHLYNAFPKLGITRRAQLRDALQRTGLGHERG